ncbi:DJ-1/PfpI family protein [Tenacibaculum ovolyticum]|uniref:DJ-1/PfpI family protein n=1 Tax=Tenacibaculum ovolyticum TaxID=104270 RepID=UPI0022F39288|nr:DJ-1/PfpI family protein [Tenacibaculum ovolyticum]WBX77401.1 DJ-1/PfpI family protein [Tenacibaculum ovolyticum]
MRIIIYIYNGITMLDAIGPYEVLRNMRDAEVYFVAENKGEIKADSDFVHLNAKYDINEIESADILLIPGSAITFIREMKNKKVLNWINKIDKTTKWTTSVCSGSLILAAAGLLKGKNATSHWKPINLLKDFGVTPKNERIIKQGKYITAAGVSAGIDMALYLSNEIVGETETKAIQLVIEYDPNPIYDCGSISKASNEVIKMAEIKLAKDAKKEIGLIDILKSGKTLMKIKKNKLL